MKLKNKIAIVTGASRGIGKGIAFAFSEALDLLITYELYQKLRSKRDGFVYI